MNEKVYIATVAEKGGGKGLFVQIIKKLLPERRIASVRFSDVLCDILDMLGKEKSRDNIDVLVTALRDAFHDEGLLASAIEKRLEAMNADIIILDGLRKEKEISLVHKRRGLLVHIVADQKIRFERVSQRREKSDEVGIPWEKFVEQENAAPQLDIRRIGETMADAQIENNGSMQEFEAAVKKFLQEHGIAR